MNARARLKSYEKLEFSITIDAPVKDWRELLAQLAKTKDRDGYHPWPVDGLVLLIEKMVDDLDKTYSDVLIREPEAKS